VEGQSGIRGWYEVEGRRVARSVARKLLRGSHLSPNVVTVTGTVLNAVAAVLVFHQEFLAAGIVFVLGSLLDAMDGAVAKVTGQVTAFGGFLDSTLDRVSEGLMLGGLGLMFSQQDGPWSDHMPWPLAACFVALASSYLVSYTRARAEALGVECKGGLASRTERIVVLAIGLFLATFWPSATEYAAYVLAVAAALTVLQRIAHVKRALPDGRKPRRERAPSHKGASNDHLREQPESQRE
jgi:CDP-diacylglycerol--glycerol-3-phosphate 3-phosphatidyltransferase